MPKKALNHNHAEENKNSKNSNLWLGFAFGALAATSVAFLLGTKKGRVMLKKLLEMSENLEENAVEIAEHIEEMLMEKTSINKEQKENKPLLGNILEKIKILRN